MEANVTDNRQIENEVLGAFAALVNASRALDADLYMGFIDTEKFSGLGADGTAWHSAQVLDQLVRSGFPMVDNIASLEFDRVKVTVINASTAILVNQYQQTLVLKDQSVVRQAGGGTQVWSKAGAAWKLVSISASDAVPRGAAVF